MGNSQTKPLPSTIQSNIQVSDQSTKHILPSARDDFQTFANSIGTSSPKFNRGQVIKDNGEAEDIEDWVHVLRPSFEEINSHPKSIARRLGSPIRFAEQTSGIAKRKRKDRKNVKGLRRGRPMRRFGRFEAQSELEKLQL